MGVSSVSNQKKLRDLITIDSEKCINCHQCISVCPSKFCNDGSGEYIKINPNLCVGCGACIEACTHEARSGIDDFSQFLNDLQNSSKIVAIVAPAIAANFPGMYLNFNSWLKKIGVKAVFDVSFGAELTVKSYIDALKTQHLEHIIAQPCPALVGYIQLHHPELIPFLAPADSPMLHTLRMIREFYPQWSDAKFLVISPCYVKKREFDEVGIGDYNVTFKSLDAYFKENKINLADFPPEQYDNPDAERAVLFSTPGGLLRTAQREIPGVEKVSRKIEGRHTVYHYLDSFPESIKKGIAPLLLDCLSCEMGCNGGPGTLNVGKSPDEIESLVEKRNVAAQQEYLKKAGIFGKKLARKKINDQLNKHWKKGLYNRTYENHSSLFTEAVRMPSFSEMDKLNRDMKKFAKKDLLNCCSCGYNSCEQMNIAIYNGLNKPENCRHFQEISISEMARQSEQLAETSKKLAKKSEQDSVTWKNVATELQSYLQGSIDSLMSLSSATEEMSTTIYDVANNSAIASASSVETKTQAISVSAIMKQLGDSATAINVIVQTITDITTQTNLLALNAAIEAATAGVAGKGFAVIANEVKSLAKRAALSSEDITQKVEGIQKSVGSAVSNVTNIVELIQEAEHLITQISGAIKEQSSAAQLIAENIALTLSFVQNGMAKVSTMID